MSGYYKYVRLGDVVMHMALGWAYECELQSPHGEYSCLMRWTGEGEPE